MSEHKEVLRLLCRHPCSLAFSLAEILRSRKHTLLVVVRSNTEAQRLKNELALFADPDTQILVFPERGILPYDRVSPSAVAIGKRLSILHKLKEMKGGFCIASLDSALSRLPPLSYLQEHSKTVEVGHVCDMHALTRHLEGVGYENVNLVRRPGEFALRGSVVDCFPPSYEQPIRLDFIDDLVESIRCFSAATQLGEAQIRKISILPSREIVPDENSVRTFRCNFRSTFAVDTGESMIYREVSKHALPEGTENYLPLFFDHTVALSDFLSSDSCVVHSEAVALDLRERWSEIQTFYQEAQKRMPAILEPKELFFEPGEILEKFCAFDTCEISDLRHESISTSDLCKTRHLPALKVGQMEEDNTGVALTPYLESFSGRALLTAASQGVKTLLLEMLDTVSLCPESVDDWHAFLHSDVCLGITIGKLQEGTVFTDLGVAVISDLQLLGKKFPSSETTRQSPDAETFINSLADLELGCPVVHEEHGVGRYRGMKNIDTAGLITECLILEYADSDILYVPVTCLPSVSRYSGGNPENAPLHKLGMERWKKEKRRAAQKAYDVAAELLDTQARREVGKKNPVKIDEEAYAQFIKSFPYQETPDQDKTLNEIKKDLLGSRPMERIVCGDVGFGKTEIAIRAAFIAAYSGYQVALLTPTTILCEQHFENFKDRFAPWPIKAAMLSRFCSPAERKEILLSLAAGTTDVVIGTHLLLQKKVCFARLGLVVVDEEQRFGVRHKECLKRMHGNVDMLTMTATPIPRSLNMSLSGLYDISIIATPPEGRLNIKTFVTEWDEALVLEACQRELRRGGQIFFVHNRISSINEIVRYLQDLLPGVEIRYAHAQMPEKELESIMHEFSQLVFSILVCTTIIESGLDIPTANTIIIDRAEQFGLAQLHQLRGRVGRSHRQAYAYFIISRSRKELNEEAVKRLRAVAAAEEQGMGFTLATHDLEIRGAGEFLGERQSGKIQEVGFSIYNQFLKRAVEALRAGHLPDFDKPLNVITEINLDEPALIPDAWLPDVGLRLFFYRQIAAYKRPEQLDFLKAEMIDRFGPFPASVDNLFVCAKIRIRAQKVGIKTVHAEPKRCVFYFEKDPKINMGCFLALMKESPKLYTLDPSGNRLICRIETETVQDRRQFIDELFAKITPATIQ